MKSIEEICSEILGKEMQIIDDFVKTYLACQSIQGKDLIHIIENLQLNKKVTSLSDPFGNWTFWISLKDKEEILDER